MSTLYDFKLTNIDDQPVDLAQYKGKVALVVNVASKCGYTKQYKGLESLYREYKDKGFEILGFPSNDFGAQEPGTEAEIKSFCSLTYDVTFDMFSKVKVSGSDMTDAYKYLTETTGSQVKWNFNKFLVDKEGKVVKYYPSSVAPEDADLRKDIEALLG
ncbi:MULTISPECIES: glutathione peroxidase [Pseudanabaena]|uniref:glutathione peroxidase n=1 Tax=Pseudanabaena TaxID=1152 RepID=UPI00247865A7|nr:MULTISPECIES: glutathione peroxidase [Pseudanabaena]MEA5489815.1 glutathione peroxidase [Pseudanabaena sp. CCNP1317]WGS71050.1 glutathione peroxidase [Pseudanabaena galeata CCNP1313]